MVNGVSLNIEYMIADHGNQKESMIYCNVMVPVRSYTKFHPVIDDQTSNALLKV